jgi:uncharacterized protein YrzB (UPF0473 family)
MSEELEQNYVEICDEEGNVTKCEVYDVVDFEEKTYALLLPIEENEEDEDGELIVMEYVEEGEDVYFQNIEDENEFEKVCEYIRTLEYDDEDEE